MAAKKETYEVLKTCAYEGEDGKKVNIFQNPRPEVNGNATVKLTSAQAKGLLKIKAIKSRKR